MFLAAHDADGLTPRAPRLAPADWMHQPASGRKTAAAGPGMSTATLASLHPAGWPWVYGDVGVGSTCQALDRDVTCDVAVLGGGYTGLHAALDLAEAGLDTVLVEAQHIGFGASGRNGGQLVTGYNRSMAEVARLVGPEAARRLWQIAEAGKALVLERIRYHDIDCGLGRGYVSAALHRRHLREARHWYEDWVIGQAYPSLELLDRDGIWARVRSPRYIGGLLDRDGGHLDPVRFVHGLAAAATRAGVRIHERSLATVLDTGPPPGLTVNGHRVTARWVILAGNAFLGRLVRSLDGWVMPVTTHIIATERLGESGSRDLLPLGDAVADMNHILDYFRLTPDTRLVFGSGANYSGRSSPDPAAGLRRQLLRVFPQLAEVLTPHLWGGEVAITINRLPRLARLGPRVLCAHGFSGQGLALTAIAARAMADVVRGTEERFDVLARLPHQQFPGGRHLRRPLLTLSMLWFRLRDLLG